jgi:hypothetical protein
VGERILSRLIFSTDNCRMVAYADNILVLGRSRDAVEESLQEMQRRASEFDGWLLEPRITENIRSLPGDRIHFLHHVCTFDGNRFVWSPDQRKLDDFCAAEIDDHLDMASIERAEAKVSHWRRSYPNWPEGELWEVQQLAGLAARRFYNDASPINRSRAAHALIASFFAGGRLQPIGELAPAGVISRDDERRAELVSVAEERLILMARRARLGPDAIRTINGFQATA